MDAGRMAFAADPSGAFFGLWQAGEHPGSERVNEPGAFSWAELQTRDLDAALPFYRLVFGYEVRSSPMGQITYHSSSQRARRVDRRRVRHARRDVPANRPVALGGLHRDRRHRRRRPNVRDLGEPNEGTVEIPMGRFATFGDANGAVFSLFEASRS